MSHFETFQSWTPRNVSHFETFEAWRPEKASHFESFGGWRLEKASHFESFGGWRLEKASHFESSGGWRIREVSHVSHFAGSGVYGPWGLSWCGREGAFSRCSDVGMVPRGPSVAGWIWGARVPLYSMVRICHEAWQEASVTNQGSVSGGRARFKPAAPRIADPRGRVRFSHR